MRREVKWFAWWLRVANRVGLIVALLVASIGDGMAQSGQELKTLLRVDVAMQYEWKMRKGRAAVRWTTLGEASGLSVEYGKVALAGFLYARTIADHAETRRALVERTQPAAMGLVLAGNSFRMDDWRLEAGGLGFPVYPWQRVAPDRLGNARTYTAHLIETADGSVGGKLEMAVGYERILAPAAPLVLFEALARELPAPRREVLGRVILSINGFYSRMDLTDTAGLLGSDILLMAELARLLKEERSFASRHHGETSTISRAELRTNSETLARKMGSLFERQRACGLDPDIPPARAANFFINYLWDDWVQNVMNSYAAGMKVARGQACDRDSVGENFIAIITDIRTYIQGARPFQKTW